MPFLTAAACVLNEDCPVPAFPAVAGNCACDFFVGGLNDIYFLPCTTDFSQGSITDTDTWAQLVEDDAIGYLGKGLGSMGKKSDKSERVSSCRSEEKTSITWAIKYVIKCFDLSSASAVESKITHTLKYSDKLLMVARTCQDEDRIIPVGRFNVSDLDMVLPDNSEEVGSATVEFSWKELGIPKSIVVAGLSAIVPKS